MGDYRHCAASSSSRGRATPAASAPTHHHDATRHHDDVSERAGQRQRTWADVLDLLAKITS